MIDDNSTDVSADGLIYNDDGTIDYIPYDWDDVPSDEVIAYALAYSEGFNDGLAYANARLREALKDREGGET